MQTHHTQWAGIPSNGGIKNIISIKEIKEKSEILSERGCIKGERSNPKKYDKKPRKVTHPHVIPIFRRWSQEPSLTTQGV